MKRLDSTYWTDGKDIFYRAGDEWVRVTGEDSSTEDSTRREPVDSGWIKVYPRGRK